MKKEARPMAGVDDSHHLLRTMMDLAVSLRLLEMENKDPPDMHEEITCLECRGLCNGCATCGDHGRMPRNLAYAHYLGAHGDDLLYRSKKKGETAKVFNLVAEMLAGLAFQPGGVTFAGAHYEVKPKEKLYPIIRNVER